MSLHIGLVMLNSQIVAVCDNRSEFEHQSFVK